MTDEPEDNVVFHPAMGGRAPDMVRDNDRICDPASTLESLAEIEDLRQITVVCQTDDGRDMLFSTYRHMSDVCLQLERIKHFILSQNPLNF